MLKVVTSKLEELKVVPGQRALVPTPEGDVQHVRAYARACRALKYVDLGEAAWRVRPRGVSGEEPMSPGGVEDAFEVVRVG